MPKPPRFEILLLALIKAASESGASPDDEAKKQALHQAHLAVLRAWSAGQEPRS